MYYKQIQAAVWDTVSQIKKQYSSMEVYKYWCPLFTSVSLTWLDASYIFTSEIKEIFDNQPSSFFILNASFYFLKRKENF